MLILGVFCIGIGLVYLLSSIREPHNLRLFFIGFVFCVVSLVLFYLCPERKFPQAIPCKEGTTMCIECVLPSGVALLAALPFIGGRIRALYIRCKRR